jgi:hypothetical protein
MKRQKAPSDGKRESLVSASATIDSFSKAVAAEPRSALFVPVSPRLVHLDLRLRSALRLAISQRPFLLIDHNRCSGPP